MTEPGEELGESSGALGALRARHSDRVIQTRSVVSRESCEDQDTDEDYDSLCQKLDEMLEDIKACDVQVIHYIFSWNFEINSCFSSSAQFVYCCQFKLQTRLYSEAVPTNVLEKWGEGYRGAELFTETAT